MTEFDSVEQAIAAHNNPAFQEAPKAIDMRANGTFVFSEEWTDADTAIGRASGGLA